LQNTDTMALHKAWPLVGLVFCTWAVSLGGLASLQDNCNDATVAAAGSNLLGTAGLAGVRGISASVLDCTKVYRYYWFIISYEIVIIFGLAYALATGIYATTRLAFLSLFAVASLLYMQTADTSLAIENINIFTVEQPLHRGRTLTAGSITTAVLNVVLVFVLGLEDSTEKQEAAAEP